MAGFVGIDVGKTHVRAVLVGIGYKRLAVERWAEIAIADAESLERAVQIVAVPLIEHSDGLAVAIDGDQCFTHRITIPAAAQKRLEEVLPFEVEAQIPVDIDDVVYDYRSLRRKDNKEPLVVLTAAARIETVRSRIELVRSALGRQPDRVGSGPLSLANLLTVLPALRGPGPFALVDLGAMRTEITVVAQGEAVFVRTLSQGVSGLPASASELAGELRQTFLSAATTLGAEVEAAYLLGGGSAAEGAAAYLAYESGVPVAPLPRLEIEGIDEAQQELVPRYAKALALALGAAGRGRDIDLRRGSLEYQRGFNFLKEKAPILSGLVVAIGISFVFANWAELRSLEREHVMLSAQLAQLGKEVLGEEVTDADSAAAALDRIKTAEEADPQPALDAFDMIVELAKVVPATMKHDIEEFDVQRGHVKLSGVVGSTSDAQTIATELGKHRCVNDAKIAKVTQVVNSDRQKYVLEFDLRCPEDPGGKKKPKEGDKPAGETPNKEGTP